MLRSSRPGERAFLAGVRAARAAKVASALWAPIVFGERSLGVIGLTSRRPSAFDEAARELVVSLASHAAVAIVNAQLFRDIDVRLQSKLTDLTNLSRIGQTIVDSNAAAIDLLVAHGYTPRHTSWELVVPRDGVIASRPLPGGYRIRPFDPGTESHQVYQVIEDAFNEWPGRTPGTFNKWKAIVLDRSDFDPRLLLVALNDSVVVGASVGILYGDQGWIDQIAVHRDHRNRGLARNLIVATFDQMKALGAADTRLSTDSRTGALDLYTSIGMVVHRSYTHYSKLLTG